MLIQSTTSAAGFAASPIAKTTSVDPRIEAVDKQIAGVRKSIKSMRENDQMDQSILNERIKEYEQQIQSLQQEKQQIMTEIRQEKLQSKQDDASENTAVQPAESENADFSVSIDESTQKHLAKFDDFRKTTSSMGVVREQIKGELRTAESTAYSAGASAANPEKAAKMRKALEKIDNTMSGKAKEVNRERNELSAPDNNVELGIDKQDPISEAKQEKYELEKQEEQRENANPNGGTGRMETGQFVDLNG